MITILATVVGVVAVIAVIMAMSWRVVVPTDHVHVVQRRKSSTPYGRGFEAGNVYYKVPSAIPLFGVRVSALSTSIFSVSIKDYDAYDSARVPFMVDVIAFFQVEDAVETSRRVVDFSDLGNQLQNTMRGAIRRVLAGSPINEIMGSRATLNKEFYTEVQEQTKNWGIKLNSIEFMNISDFPGTKVVTNIMDKERTTIEKESRMKVAENMREAKLAEIQADQTVALRDVEKQQTVAVNTEKAKQVVKEQEAETKRKEMAVKKVELVTSQEIAKDQARVQAEANQQVVVIQADAQAKAAQRVAEGNKLARELEGAGDSSKVAAIGKAEAEVIRAKGLSEAEATLKRAEALKQLNEAGVAVEALKANVAVQTAKWAALGQALAQADLKLVSSGKGANLFGIDLNAETGADLSVFLDQLPKEIKEKAQGLLGGLAAKVTK